MERKTVHRIFGILVVIALVIIALPLVLNKRAPAPVQVSANVPTFPNTQKENANDDAITIDPDSEPVTTANKTSEVENEAAASIGSNADTGLDQAMSAKSNISPGGKASLQEGNMLVLTPDSAAESNDMIQQMDSQTALPVADKGLSVSQDDGAITFEPKEEPKNRVTPLKPTPSADDLKKASWAVLVGSFKDKNNARRITDALRSSGYRAFSTEAKNNGLTRVYVGPEFKHITAALLANKIEKNMKLHGIVVNYKPLEL